MAKKQTKASRTKHAGGRPQEGRLRLTCYVKPRTLERLQQMAYGPDGHKTIGRAIDAVIACWLAPP